LLSRIMKSVQTKSVGLQFELEKWQAKMLAKEKERDDERMRSAWERQRMDEEKTERKKQVESKGEQKESSN
jgi:hypothetical protein